jgi:hypothetical protein
MLLAIPADVECGNCNFPAGESSSLALSYKATDTRKCDAGLNRERFLTSTGVERVPKHSPLSYAIISPYATSNATSN